MIWIIIAFLLRKNHPSAAVIMFLVSGVLSGVGTATIAYRALNNMIPYQYAVTATVYFVIDFIFFLISLNQLLTLPTTKELRIKQAEELKKVAQDLHNGESSNLYIDYSSLADAVFSDTVDLGAEFGRYESSVMEASRKLNYSALVLSRDKIAEVYKDSDIYKEQEKLLTKAFAKSMGTPTSVVRRVIRNYNDSKRYADWFQQMLNSKNELMKKYAKLVKSDVDKAFKPLTKSSKKSPTSKHSKPDLAEETLWEEF